MTWRSLGKKCYTGPMKKKKKGVGEMKEGKDAFHRILLVEEGEQTEGREGGMGFKRTSKEKNQGRYGFRIIEKNEWEEI